MVGIPPIQHGDFGFPFAMRWLLMDQHFRQAMPWGHPWASGVLEHRSQCWWASRRIHQQAEKLNHCSQNHSQMLVSWKIWVTPVIIQLLDWDFPWNQPSSELGVSPWLRSPPIGYHYWLVVWNMVFIFPNSWDENPNWLSYFSGG